MNAKQLIAAIAFVSAAGGAFAQTSGFLGNEASLSAAANVPVDSKSTVTHDRVTVDAPQAEGINGFLGSEASVAAAKNETQGQPEKVIVRAKTRAEVIAELEQSEKDGTLAQASFVGFRNPVESQNSSGMPQAIARK